jgi:hypothetical protein
MPELWTKSAQQTARKRNGKRVTATESAKQAGWKLKRPDRKRRGSATRKSGVCRASAMVVYSIRTIMVVV